MPTLIALPQMKPPPFDEFKSYAFNRIKKHGEDPNQYTDWLEDKYDAWKEAGWKKEQKGKFVPIKIWKTTLLQALPYRVANKVKPNTEEKVKRQRTGKVDEIENTTLVTAWNHFSVMRTLRDKVQMGSDCFKILVQRGCIDTDPKWQPYFDKKTERASTFYYAKEIDLGTNPNEARKKTQDAIRNQDPYIAQIASVLVVEDFFSRIKTEDELKRKVGII